MEESLRIFDEMRMGLHDEGSAILRYCKPSWTGLHIHARMAIWIAATILLLPLERQFAGGSGRDCWSKLHSKGSQARFEKQAWPLRTSPSAEI